MIDSFGRNIDYVRLSVTDRCNLRCLYCMPEGGVEQLSHLQVMRFEEMLRLCRVLSGLGVRKFKVSGGEPLVRRGVNDFIADLKSLPGVEQVTLTTNGILLRENLEQLKRAGIDGINISLDTLNEFTFRELTRNGDIDSVLDGLQAALAAKICPIKINALLLKGKNDNELENLAALSRDMEVSVLHRADAHRSGHGLRTGQRRGSAAAAHGSLRRARGIRPAHGQRPGQVLHLPRLQGEDRPHRRYNSLFLQQLQPGAHDVRRLAQAVPAIRYRRRSADSPASGSF